MTNPDEFSSHQPSPTVQLAKAAIDALEGSSAAGTRPECNAHVRAWQSYIGSLGGSKGGHRWTSKEARAVNKARHEARPVRTWEVRTLAQPGVSGTRIQARSRQEAIVAYAKTRGLAKSVNRLDRLARAVGGWVEVAVVDGEATEESK